MPIYLGSNELKPYHGSTEIGEAYLGDVLVYQNVRAFEMFPSLNVSGVWTPKSETSASGTATATVTATQITLQGRNNSGCFAYPTNKIDFSRLTKVYVTYTSTVSGGNSNRWFWVKVIDTIPTKNGDGTVIYEMRQAHSSGTVEIDVTNVEGEKYLFVRARAYITDTPRINVTITNISVE